MSNTRNIIDFAYNDQGSEMRDALYAEIHDRVISHIEAKKQELAHSILSQEEYVTENDEEEKENDEEEGHEDEKEDKKLIKKMAKKSCLAKEGIDDIEDEYDDEDEDEDEWDEDLIEELKQYSLEQIENFIQTEEYDQLDELSKNTLRSYVKKSSVAADKHLKLANAAAQRSKTKADTAQYMKHSEKFGKRIGGIEKASNRMKNNAANV